MAGLFIGRFQPFHNGHLDAIKQAFTQEDFLYIGIGSAEDNYTTENPFTAAERFQMIQETLRAEKISPEKYAIIPVRNIHNYALWPAHVELIIPPFNTVYTDSDIVAELFKTQGKHPVKRIKKNIQITATDIRKKILTDENLDPHIPPAVQALLKTWNAKERLQKIG